MTEITKIMLAKFAAISCYIFNSRISLFVSLVFCVLFDKNLSAESVFILTMYFDTIQNNMNAMFPFGKFYNNFKYLFEKKNNFVVNDPLYLFSCEWSLIYFTSKYSCEWSLTFVNDP